MSIAEERIIKHCSPTLAGLKTGSLFTLDYETEAAFKAEVIKLNRLLTPKGLRIIPMREAENKVLIYVYRPSKLQEDLRNDKIRSLLKKMGYPYKNPEKCVAHLAQKLKNSKDFPHEIGLFLSYPPEDVQGFIENKACRSKCAGYWKVYGDVAKAQKLFKMYKKCTDVYYAHWLRGSSIEKLTVVA